ncbi:MAG: L-histidine N(alpha)-methyltransferase [marine benthic group bacterium]|nr:L-histidine N(alpha)-methyltransferase [Gemmatimonadota bacterium]
MSESAHGRRIVLHNRLEERESPFRLAEDARRGLTAETRTMPPKYFYDDRGSRLFEAITRLPEYYQTRAEREILERHADAIVARIRPGVLVEFGSGAAEKTRALLDAMRSAGTLEGYAPLDVSREASQRAAEALIRDYPDLRVEGVIGDFERPHHLPFPGRRRLLAFLGSTIGNFERERSIAFLAGAAAEMSPADGFLIGFDLVKDAGTLERAYDDAAGVTAAFNLNLLRVMNRELGADFDLAGFRHRALYDASLQRIEMHLVSTRDQTVHIPAIDLTVQFAEGESIRTELSHKYTRASVDALLRRSGLALCDWFTDERQRFALALARLP